MSYELLPIDDLRWRRLVETHPEAGLVHHPAWASLIAESFGGQPCVLATPGSGEVAAGVPVIVRRRLGRPSRAVALPHTDLCPPLACDESALDTLGQACQEAREEHGWESLRICWPVPIRSARNGTAGVRHETPLQQEPESVFATFKKTAVRQRIRRAQRLKIEVIRAETWAQMRSFYDLHVMTRSRLGALVEPMRHFRLIWDRLVREGLASLLLARHEDRVVSGALFLHWNGAVHYQYGASDPEAWNLRPNHLLLWEAIRRGCERGDRVFDWGFSDLDNTGLREFKSSWGSRERAVHHTVLADRAAAPSRLSPWVSTAVLRTSPWFCRVAGELLYARMG